MGDQWTPPTNSEREQMEYYERIASKAAERQQSERRYHERRPFKAEITVNSTTNFFMGFSEDISEGGLFLSTMSPPTVGEEVTLEVKVGEGEVIAVRGAVRWHRYVGDTVTGCGIQFLDLDTQSRGRFEQLLLRLKKEPLFFEL